MCVSLIDSFDLTTDLIRPPKPLPATQLAYARIAGRALHSSRFSRIYPLPTQNLRLGIACAVAVFFIWSSFFVFSRLGVSSELTPFDLTALRFIVAGALVLPFGWQWWPRHLSWQGLLVMGLFGPGALYTLIMYTGLSNAPAAYAGVFANGSLPVFSVLFLLAFRGEKPTWNQLLGIAVILAGSVMLSLQGLASGADDVVTGIVFFLMASALISIYLFGVQHWRLTPRQALALVTIPNGLVYLPVWYFFLPSGLAQTDQSTVIAQALFQGLGPGFLAVLMFAAATIHLGSTATSGFAASVPAGATVLAMPVLAEYPTPLEWVGVGTVTAGLAITMLRR